MPGAFDDLIPAAQKPQSRYVAPIVGGTDPYKASAEARAQEDQARQRQLDELRAENERMRNASTAKGLEATGGVDASVEQGKAASFFNRASKANSELDRLIGEYNLDPDSMVGHTADAIAPGMTSKFASDERNAARSVVRDFISATLRYESGAAIPPSEFLNQYQIYFPSPDAGPEEIATKARARQTAIEGLKIGAGPAAARVETSARVGNDYEGGNKIAGRGETSKLIPIPPEMQGKYNAWLDAHGRGFDPQDYAMMRMQLDRENNYGVDPDTFSRYLEEGKRIADPTSNVNRTIPGVEAPMSEAEQGVNNLVQTPGGTVAANYFNQAALGAPQALAGQEGYDAMSALSERNPVSAFAGAMAGGITGAKWLGAGSEAVSRALGFGPEAARMLANPVTQNALAGGAVGFTTAPEGQGAQNALIGAGVAGGLTKGAQAVSKAWNARPAVIARQSEKAAQQADGANIAAAGQAEDVLVSRPMVDPKVQNRVTGTEATIAGGPVVRSSLNKTATGIERGLGRLSPAGIARETDVAGEQLQASVSRIDKQGRDKVNKIYDEYRKQSGDPPVQPKLALSKIDDEIADLSKRENTSEGEINYLKKVRKDFASGKMTVQSIIDLRRDLRGQLKSQGLDMTQAEARILRVMDAAMKDAEGGLSGNPKGLALLKQANRAHRERKIFTKAITEQIIGRDPEDLSKAVDPGEAWATITRWAKPGGKTNRLTAMWSKLAPDEANDLAATHASILGRDKAGNFSPALLVSQAAAISPRARVAIWGKDGAESINNLLTLANAHKRVFGQLNHTKSGVAVTSARDYRSWLSGALGLAGGVGTGSTLTGLAIAATAAGGAAAKDAISARLLMTPSISKWIATAPATATPKAINSHFDRLSQIAAREPVISGEIQTLQQRLMDAAKGMSGPAPAEDKQNTR